MTATCYYHSDQVAPNSCIQCGVPICNNCRENIAGKTVCKRCAPAFAQRVQASPSMYAAPPAYGAPASPATGQSFAVTTGTDVSVGQRLAGLGVGLVIGIIGAIIWTDSILVLGHSLANEINKTIGADNIDKYILGVVILIVLIAAAPLLFDVFRRQRAKRRTAGSTAFDETTEPPASSRPASHRR